MSFEKNRIGALTQVNAGWISKLWLIPIDQVIAVLMPPVLGKAATVPAYGLPLVEGAVITEFSFPVQDCRYKESSARTSDGTMWVTELTLQMPGQIPDLLNWIFTNDGREWLAVWLDGNGSAFVAGEPERGLKLAIGRSIEQNNYLNINLVGRNWHPAWRLEDANLSTLIPYSQLYFNADPALFGISS